MGMRTRDLAAISVREKDDGKEFLVGYLVFRPQADPDAPPIRATWRTAADD